VTPLEAFALSDPYLPAVLAAMARDRRERDVAAEERALKRRMLGCCPCGRAPGADVCPVCDLGIPIPRGAERLDARTVCREFIETLTATAKQIGDAAREGGREVADLAAAMEALAPKKKQTVALAARPPNRFERRRAAAQRRSG
jgi:hypothetical protein